VARLGNLAADQARNRDLLAFDRSLKARGLNPGTSADLTVATLFAASLQALEMGC
jgi:triphosphoribosyl-dephospho-CoA synthase